MKKVVSICMILLVSVALVGCKKKTQPAAAPAPVVEQVADVPEVEAPMDEGKYAEYQLNVDIVSTDAEGNEYGVKTKMYKKGEKSLYVIEEMSGPQELPFTPTQNLLVGTDLYSNIILDGESMRFKADGVQDQADAMFDLAKMQDQVMAQTEGAEVVEEEIDGQTMQCYIMPTGGKICLVDGMFTYGEDMDPLSGMKSVIRVSNYTETVDDDVFALPSDDEVKDMSEFMQLMMAALQEEGADVIVAPESDIVPAE